MSECEAPDPSTVLRQLYEIYSDPDCAKQEKRQLILLETFFTVAEDRVKLSDLRFATKILDVLQERAWLESKFQPQLQNLLKLLKAPLRMEKSSDQLEYQGSLVEFFTTIGYILLRTDITRVQSDLLDVVLRILLIKRIGDSDMVPVNSCSKALELSELAECLADFIGIVEKEIYGMAIFTTLQVALASKLCCWTLLKKEVIEALLVRLTQVYDEEDVADNVTHLLWTLLNCTRRREDWQKVPQPSRIALRGLRYVLREQALTHSHPGKNNNVLCNTAALTLKIIHLFPGADYVHSGLMEDITLSATLTEAVLEIHIIPFFKTKEDHLRFKKLMLACLAASPPNPASIEIYERYKLAECLVCMLRLDPTRTKLSWLSCSASSSVGLAGSPRKSSSTAYTDTVWFNISEEQSIDIFKAAVPVVCSLFDCLVHSFIRAGLVETLVKFLKTNYLQNMKTVDELFHKVVKLIFFVCFSKKNPGLVRDSLIKAGAVPTLLDSCFLILDVPLTLRIQSILCFILHISSALMDEDSDLKVHYSSNCFQLVQSLYHRIIQPLQNDSVINNKLIVAVSNFAWVALVTQEENLLEFIDSGELYSHLDILERSDLPTQLVYLSTLVDIVEQHKAIPYLVSWRGRKGAKLLSVLCRMWRKEEDRLKVPRDKNGCITDRERPIMGEDQYKMSSQDKKNYLAVCDVFGSCRPKIYALVQLLHRHEDVARLCEDHYRLGYDVLDWGDQVTLQLIESYFPLKLGEVWWEIFNKQEEVLPLDRYLAQNLADRYLNWTISTQKAQRAVLEQRDAAMKQEEHQYYLQVRSVRLTAALEALREVTVIARSADRQVLLAAHGRLREGIDASRPADSSDLDLHVAFPRDVRVLVVNPAAEVSLGDTITTDVSSEASEND